MPLTRLIATAAAAALIACPAIALAQTTPVAGPTTTPSTDTTPAPPKPVLPSIPKVEPGPDIYDTLKASGQFTILLKGIDETGLAPYLQKYPYTYLAPTDAAFNALPPDVLAKLMAPNDTAANQLQQVLAYMLLAQPVGGDAIRGHKGSTVSAEKGMIELDGSDPDDLKVNNADIIQADIRTTNGGIVHVIDKVLIPSDSPYYAQVTAVQAPPAPPPAPAPQTAATGGTTTP